MTFDSNFIESNEEDFILAKNGSLSGSKRAIVIQDFLKHTHDGTSESRVDYLAISDGNGKYYQLYVHKEDSK